MKIILTNEEKSQIIEFLSNNEHKTLDLDRQSKKNFYKKVKNYVLDRNGILLFKVNEEDFRIVIADDDISKQIEIFNEMH